MSQYYRACQSETKASCQPLRPEIMIKLLLTWQTIISTAMICKKSVRSLLNIAFFLGVCLGFRMIQFYCSASPIGVSHPAKLRMYMWFIFISLYHSLSLYIFHQITALIYYYYSNLHLSHCFLNEKYLSYYVTDQCFPSQTNLKRLTMVSVTLLHS